MNEPHPATSLGPIMKAARKFKKFNQADVAHAIGCSQSALSKMEHSLLTPSAPQWFLFARFTAIPPETIETGIIDRHSKVSLNDFCVLRWCRLCHTGSCCQIVILKVRHGHAGCHGNG